MQITVQRLTRLGAIVDITGIGPVGRGAGENVLAQVADLERQKIRALRRDVRRPKRHLRRRKTQHGKTSLGRPRAANAQEVTTWRKANGPDSIKETAERFGLSLATVSGTAPWPDEESLSGSTKASKADKSSLAPNGGLITCHMALSAVIQ